MCIYGFVVVFSQDPEDFLTPLRCLSLSRDLPRQDKKNHEYDQEDIGSQNRLFAHWACMFQHHMSHVQSIP